MMTKTKELYEAIDNLWANLAHTNYTENYSTRDRNLLIEAVKLLEAIENANPSEAMRCLDILGDFSWLKKPYKEQFPDLFNTIKQSLLKAQEQEKINAYVEKIKTMMMQKDCVLRYVESEDCFAVKTILSGWYKLTPEFVENNVREEIKPSSLIEKNRQLREENAEYKEVLKLVFDRKVDIYHLSKSKTVEDYNSIWDYSTYCLTEEEFELIKRYLKIFTEKE